MPQSLNEALEKLVYGLHREDMAKNAQTLSERYRTLNGTGGRLVTGEAEALAYAASRMPATFCAVHDALEQALAPLTSMPRTMMDAGAGTGAASWAAEAILKLDSALCLEREEAMRRTGQALMQAGPPALAKAVWLERDICTDTLCERAELVIMAYVLNELKDGMRAEAVAKLWNAAVSLLVIVEPGTPAGYRNLMEARRQLLSMGAHIAAPCPHERECPMPEGDWCHFACRVPRSQLHRVLKGGQAPYEDEKYAYMAFSREACRPVQNRVLRHPQIRTGHVMAVLCREAGIHTRTVSKKDGALYKLLRGLKAGDGFS